MARRCARRLEFGFRREIVHGSAWQTLCHSVYYRQAYFHASSWRTARCLPAATSVYGLLGAVARVKRPRCDPVKLRKPGVESILLWNIRHSRPLRRSLRRLFQLRMPGGVASTLGFCAKCRRCSESQPPGRKLAMMPIPASLAPQCCDLMPRQHRPCYGNLARCDYASAQYGAGTK